MFAVIKTGGKQYQVEEGKTISIEKLPQAENEKVEFEPLLVAEEDGSKVTVGTPLVSGVKVQATVVGHARDKKVRVEKFKSKSRYHKVQGHRQHETQIRIDKISA